MIERTDVQEPIEKALRTAGWYVVRLQLTSGRGWPDDLAFRRGECLAVECKIPGGMLSPQQKVIHELLNNVGIKTIVAESVDDLPAYAVLSD